MSKNKTDKPLPDLVYDANKKRWEYYNKIYPSFKINSQLLYRNTNKTRLVGRFKYSNGDLQNAIEIEHISKNQRLKKSKKEWSIVLSGDCFFNFSEKKINSYIKTINPKKEETLKLLKSCAANYLSDENCVLMPVTGAMNNIKGKAYFKDKTLTISGNGRRPFNAYDRPDTLIYMLDQFYSKKKKKLSLYDAGLFFSSSIFRDSLNGLNFSEYYNFMNSFNSVVDFCSVFFKIDEKFTKRMIASGKKPIKSEDNLLNYLNLAQDYWKSRTQLAKELGLPTSWHPI